MSTNLPYEKHDPLRVCDICGVLWHKSELTRIAPLRWACPDDKDGLTAEQISRHNANVRPLRVKPVKHAKGPHEVPTYQQAEGVILNLLLANAPSQVFLAERGMAGARQSVTGLDGARAAGWMAFYLANLVLENRRPAFWISQATAKLTSLCDSMVASQFGVGTTAPYANFGSATTAYGGVFFSAQGSPTILSLDVLATATCMLALLRTYRATGKLSYLLAARAGATFLRRAQCVGLYTTAYAAFDAGGTHMQPGPFPDVVSYNFQLGTNNTGISSYNFRPMNIVCAWALNELRAVDGDATYGDAAAAGDFMAPTASTLSGAVAQCVSWWANGASGIVGFGPTTPKSFYVARVTGVDPSWATTSGPGGQVVPGYDYSAGIRALYEIGGYTPQVAGLYEWLRSFTADPTNSASGLSADQTERSTKGDYDPTLAMARYLRVVDLNGNAVATEGVNVSSTSGTGPGYDWRTLGMLAPIQSARQQADFGDAKHIASMARTRRWTVRRPGAGIADVSTLAYDPVRLKDDLRLLSFSGLSFQTSVGMRHPEWTGTGLNFGHYIDLEQAAIVGDIYRYAPQAFPLEQG